ncbi:MAG: nucleotidyltransferase family protein [Oscillospiraceae bacterium]|nr:nucleotidyltransferase family protein [Oscillospiraceae bacterium]
MELLGIIAEYDPFHPGHLYHIQQSRRESGADAVAVILSGDFVQRGGAAMLDKFARSEMAIRCGADLVIELPLPWCMAGAETFARGGVGLLDALGCADVLSFGSECGDISALEDTVRALCTAETEETLRELLRSGLPYAAAREKAVERTAGRACARLLQQPNNILAIEYLKALNTLGSEIRPMTLRREGSVHNGVGSASELREKYYKGEQIDGLLPEAAAAVLRRETERGALPERERLETALLSRLRMLDEESWHTLPDCSEGLENRLYRAARRENSIEAILDAAASGRYPRARVRRILYAAALGLRSGDADGVPPYIRPLAANEKGREVLHLLRKTARLPIISRGGQTHKLDSRAEKIFRLCSAAHDFYALGKENPELRFSDQDYQKSLCIFCDF